MQNRVLKEKHIPKSEFGNEMGKLCVVIASSAKQSLKSTDGWRLLHRFALRNDITDAKRNAHSQIGVWE